MDDPYVALARASYTAFVNDGTRIKAPNMLPPYLRNERGACFVSLHKDGELRGCIGTLEPTRRSIADEVIQNAISACSRDPRFPPVRPDELPRITCSVDVLGEPEPIEGIDQLDPKKYGVIVSSGWRRGVLLPDLEGVGDAQTQVAIAKRKAGIAPGDHCGLQRFTVVRHV
ncbi:AmmeMemoRadiSam system protein A [Curtanaerobium respiraculi]|uniref:AmmeMemoRadiSam system protein A n=1 Tax=Curtanaerobium respiraculi TaxID=2949669 RepID=UPI0024B34AD4|nr:AmmeMemoRadiSam system protein A [Curtanaerobium respiraculi]